MSTNCPWAPHTEELFQGPPCLRAGNNIPARQHQTVSLMVSTHTVGQGTNWGWGSTGWGSRADPCMAQILAVMGYVTTQHFPQGVGRPPLGLQNFLIEQTLQMDRLKDVPSSANSPKNIGVPVSTILVFPSCFGKYQTSIKKSNLLQHPSEDNLIKSSKSPWVDF